MRLQRLELTVGDAICLIDLVMGAVFIELVVGAAYFGGLWTLSFSIGSCSVLIVTWKENFLAVRMTDRVSTRLLSHTISSRYV